MAMLRPHEPPGGSMYPLEEDPATIHIAALGSGRNVIDVLAVGSVLAEPHPLSPRAGDWRVRGMATRADMQGRGLGSLVLEAIENAARQGGGERLWCNARTPARAFYERAGFGSEGEEFEIAGIGPHLLMSKALD
jgi:GNAT superfamily N-acetyltransferase